MLSSLRDGKDILIYIEKVYILIQWFKLIPNIMFCSKHIAPGPVYKKEIVVNTLKQDAPQENVQLSA